MTCGNKVGPFDCCSVVQIDAWQALSLLPENSVGLVLTDPPYDAITHKGARTRGDALASGFGVSEFLSFDKTDVARLVQASLRICPRWNLFFCGDRQLGHYIDAASDAYVRDGVWVKIGAAPQFTGDRPAYGVEHIAILHGSEKKRWNGGGRHAVWVLPKCRNKEHPTQKPDKLITELVELFSDENEVVLDPFAGSGTTAVAAISSGRHFLCFENNADYIQLAQRRITDARNKVVRTKGSLDQLTFGDEFGDRE